MIKKYILFLFVFLSSLFANELKQVSLQLQWKYQFQFAGFIMAKEKGYYKEIGLDVDIKEWSKNVDMVKETINGNSSYAMVRPSSLINVGNGDDISFLAAIFQSSPLIILANKKSKIKTIKDFENKRLMTTGDLNNDASVISMMFSQGINVKNITMQNPTFNVKDLLDNKTDLVASYISNEPYVLSEMGGEPLIFNPKDYGFDFYNDILITSNKYLNENPNEVKEFKDASLKGWEYAFSNIEEAVELILKKYNTQNKSKDALIYEAKELKKLAYFETDKIGKIEKNKLEKIYDVYKLLGLTKGTINYDNLIFNSNNLLTNKEKAYLNKKKSFTYCIDPNWMPFEKIEDEKHIGLSAQYIKLFSEKLGVDFKLIPTDSWAQTIEFAKNRTCDLIALAAETNSRKEWFNFTTAYLKVPLVIVTKLDVPFINYPSTLKNKKLGVTKAYAFGELLRTKYPYLNIIDVEDIDDGLKKVARGEIYGYIGTIATVEYIFQDKYYNELKISGKFDENLEHGVAVRNDDLSLLNVLNKTIHNLNTEQKQTILNDSISLTVKKGMDYSLVYKILFVVFILIIFFIYKQYLLKKSLNDINDVINATIEGLVLSKNGICIDANQSALEIFGFKEKEELMGRTVFDFFSEESMELITKRYKSSNTQAYEAILLRNDGSKFYALVRGYNLKNRNLRVSSLIDISHLKSQERLLVEQSKMAALGEMLSNIAHQWRQPLAAISASSTGMILQKEHKLLSDEDFFNSCNTINNYSQYLSKTIDDFSNYAKGDTVTKEFNLKEETQKFLLLVDSFVKDYQIIVDLDSDESIYINGYPNELIQCLINLFYNSKDVFLQNENQDKKYIQIIQKADKDFASIIFRDNGGGILDEVIDKIFEPYFTTKHKSQGTGIGLHMTYNLIVNSMNGFIEVENVTLTHEKKEYLGAQFTIKIPLSH